MSMLTITLWRGDGTSVQLGPFLAVTIGQTYLYGFAPGHGKRMLARRRDEGGWVLFGTDEHFDRLTVTEVPGAPS